MELTASEVYELVKGWPDEARPKQLEFLRKQWRPTNYLRNDPPLFDFHAADLHAMAGLRWLIGQGRILDAIAVVLDTRDTLHAVSAAVLAVKG